MMMQHECIISPTSTRHGFNVCRWVYEPPSNQLFLPPASTWRKSPEIPPGRRRPSHESVINSTTSRSPSLGKQVPVNLWGIKRAIKFDVNKATCKIFLCGQFTLCCCCCRRKWTEKTTEQTNETRLNTTNKETGPRRNLPGELRPIQFAISFVHVVLDFLFHFIFYVLVKCRLSEGATTWIFHSLRKFIASLHWKCINIYRLMHRIASINVLLNRLKKSKYEQQ
jgi:hypothetical protein